jgi:hypothetical protein
VAQRPCAPGADGDRGREAVPSSKPTARAERRRV